mmetsp:Transcript_38309/g.41528  ORF Transcript_38309/g.41528 Transcript_38309/m.41528 type:complete len:226 (-) Transcript_38309:5-682(-)
MSSKEKREHDQDHIGRNQSIGNKKTTKQNNLNFVRDGISRKFESISDDMWWVSTNSSGRDGQPYAKAMIQYPIYFNCKFTRARFGMLLGLATPHHNIEIALECLIKLRIMANSADCIGLKVCRIVELICQHIQYEDDDGIEEEPNELLSIGNTKITARKLKLNSSRNKRKNDPTNNSSGKKKKVSRTTLPLQISNTNTFTVTKLCNFCKICYLNTINNRTRIAAC